MFDNRKTKRIELGNSKSLKDGAAYKVTDSITGKDLVVKLIANYDDSYDEYLIAEFRKLARLSAEPEIGFVYYLASTTVNNVSRSCYVMDFIQGKTLGSVLSSSDSISYELAVSIASELASGLEKAHHYDVFHNDLHDNNVIIDEFGKVKIIDFLWHDFTAANKEKFIKDLQDFKDIAQSLFNKCTEADRRRFAYINDACQIANNLFGLSKKIELLSEISLDLVRFDMRGKLLLSKLLNNLPLDLSQSGCFFAENIEVPRCCQCYDSTANIIDKRAIDIEDCLKRQFYSALQQLKASDLIDWVLKVNNFGQPNIGPYSFTYRIDIRSKAIKWHVLLHQHYFLPKPFDETIHEYIAKNA